MNDYLFIVLMIDSFMQDEFNMMQCECDFFPILTSINDFETYHQQISQVLFTVEQSFLYDLTHHDEYLRTEVFDLSQHELYDESTLVYVCTPMTWVIDDSGRPQSC